MTKNQFEQLSETEQLGLLSRYGIFLVERIVNGNRIYLYAISSFYIELFHELARLDRSSISVLKIFDDVKYLDAYMTHVDISNLEKCF